MGNSWPFLPSTCTHSSRSGHSSRACGWCAGSRQNEGQPRMQTSAAREEFQHIRPPARPQNGQRRKKGSFVHPSSRPNLNSCIIGFRTRPPDGEKQAAARALGGRRRQTSKLVGRRYYLSSTLTRLEPDASVCSLALVHQRLCSQRHCVFLSRERNEKHSRPNK